MTDILLVPSPLLGPATWASTAAWLASAGHSARVVDTAGVRTPTDVVDAVVAAAGSDTVVLVPHSNAGLAAPVVGAKVDLRATVFVDAALPLGAGSTAMAPEGLLAMLEGMAGDDGLLPPWTEWWEDLTGLFPGEDSRATIEAGQLRLPVSYFSARLPVPDAWASRPSAYLAFGDTYAEEIAFARDHTWPVTVLDGRHLHQLHDPGAVAQAVLHLLRALPS